LGKLLSKRIQEVGRDSWDSVRWFWEKEGASAGLKKSWCAEVWRRASAYEGLSGGGVRIRVCGRECRVLSSDVWGVDSRRSVGGTGISSNR